MGLRFSFRQRAGEHTVYAPTAFDNEIGKTIPLHASGRIATATIVGVKVSDDGTEAEFTLEAGMALDVDDAPTIPHA